MDFERARRSVSAEAIAAIRAALESAGVEFTDGNAPGVNLHKAGTRVTTIPLEDLNAENDE